MENGEDLYITVFTELKSLGVKVPKVKKFKSAIPKQEKILGKSQNKIFGVSLAEQEWVANSESLPKFLADSTSYLLSHSKVEGLFRKAGSVARQKKLRINLENGASLEGSDANDVASLLKQWLRELSEPLIPHYIQDLFIRCQHLDNEENRITATLLSCLLLPPDHLHTLKHLLCFLAKLAFDHIKNKMGTYNLALMMAPNIFVPATESADKTGNNLIYLHTSIIQLLIENYFKIGEVRPSVILQCSAPEGKSGSELDSSGDLLDFSPYKSKKKRRSGQFQDIFNGIKKLVGQNGPSTNIKATPEKNWNHRITTPISGGKRKADPELLLSTKKQAKILNNTEIAPNATPKNKENRKFLEVENRPRTHSRRKSFGLLRRKDKRKHSHKSNCPMTMSLAVTNLQSDNNAGIMNSDLQTEVTTISKKGTPITIQLTEGSFENFQKSINMKKSISDCYLTESRKAFSESSKPNVFSHSNLQDKPLVCSPYWLRSDTVENANNYQNILSDSLNELNNLLKKEKSTDGHKAKLTRQEAFIMKSLKKIDSIEDVNKNLQKSFSNESSNFKDHTSVSKLKSVNKSTHSMKAPKKTTRHSSLVRGRPNSVKSGLPHQPLITDMQSFDANTKKEAFIELKINQQNTQPGQYFSPREDHEIPETVTVCPEIENTSLITKLEDFSLSPKFTEDFLFIDSDEKLDEAPPSVKKKSTLSKLKARSNASFEIRYKSGRKSSLPASLDNITDENDQKIHIMVDKSLSVSRTNSRSSRKRKTKRSLMPEDENVSECCRKRTSPEMHVSGVSNEISLDDSCFKTPNLIQPDSPNSVTWVSGIKYLGLDSPQEEAFNKRESIARILKNNPGHVLQKVSLFDNGIRNGTYTRSVQSCSTPYTTLCSDECDSGNADVFSRSKHRPDSQNRKPLTTSVSWDSPRSHSKRKSRYRKSPIPPPPKFEFEKMDNPSPKISQPLKEVTNTCFGMDESQNATPPKRETPNVSPNSCDKIRKSRKRNSFSGHTPCKFSKMVTRSKSSPLCYKQNNKVSTSIQFSYNPTIRFEIPFE